MNKFISIVAIILLVLVLLHGLSHAWMALGVIKFLFIIIAFVGVGWVWGKFTR